MEEIRKDILKVDRHNFITQSNNMKKALVIGINDYPNSPLQGCINDASGLGSIIETHGDGSPNFDVRLETNVPTKSALTTMIVDLFEGDCDTVLFYFSGHGFVNQIGGYIVTPDHQKYAEGVSMDEILQLANESKAKDKIIILDCCHSGTLGSPKTTKGSSLLNEGVSILTASRENEPSLEVNGHGIFTNLLLDALQGGASDLRGHITPGSVYAYIDLALGPWEQRPVFKTNVTRFTSLRTVPPQVPTIILRKLIEYFPSPSHNFPLDPTFEYTNENIAKPENVEIFKHLQKFASVGLVIPIDEDHMYWAAQNSKSCKLTAYGNHYWRLVKDKRI